MEVVLTTLLRIIEHLAMGRVKEPGMAVQGDRSWGAQVSDSDNFLSRDRECSPG